MKSTASIRPFVLLRYTLIVATAYLLLVESNFSTPPLGIVLLIVGALMSNVILAQFPPAASEHVAFGVALILGDTAWITAALLQSGRFNAEFFYLYFFILLLAAIGENLRVIVVGAAATCIAYLYVLSATGGNWSLWNSPSLIRLPFLFTVAAFYGHLVDRTRQERRRADATTDELHVQAQISAALVRVGREMLSSLDTPVILDRLCQITTEVLECDCSHTFLWQPDEHAYVPVSGYGDTIEQWELVRMMRIPRAAMAHLLSQLEQHEVVHLIPTATPGLSAVFAMERGSNATLYIALRRGDTIIGILTAGHRTHGRSFAERHERIARGITQIASITLANAELLEELAHANRLKSEFVATMSHELRTPLHIILGYSEMLLGGSYGELTAAQADPLQRMDKNARELLGMIQATLDLSRLEGNKVDVQVQEVAVPSFLHELDSETRKLQQASALRFEWDIPAELPTLRSDPIKLKMILKNLISNAVKFTDAGHVKVAALARDGGVEISVSDSGMGIAPDQHAAIFEAFRQGDGSDTRRHDGAGLGLYIVQRLLQVLGGSVSLQSEIGLGSTFRVWVPAELESNRTPPLPGYVLPECSDCRRHGTGDPASTRPWRGFAGRAEASAHRRSSIGVTNSGLCP